MPRLIIYWILLICSARLQAADWKLLDVDELFLDYGKRQSSTRDPYVPEYTNRWREEIALNWNVSLVKYMFWENRVHTETITSGQVKTVGWEWRLGMHLGKYFDVFQYHHSRHVMENEPEDRFPGNDFPVENAYMIRMKFISREGSK